MPEPKKKKSSATASGTASPRTRLTPDILSRVHDAVAAFNARKMRKTGQEFCATGKGKHVFLGYRGGIQNRPHPVCRVEWTGDFERWKFAIFRYSDNGYDPHERFFPGAEHLDGSIEGALMAGMTAYPPGDDIHPGDLSGLVDVLMNVMYGSGKPVSRARGKK